MFYFRSFMVLSLMFKSLMHFELIFEYGLRQGSSFIFFACENYTVFPAPFIEETFPCIFLVPL